jgi:hypothetical protein
MALMDDWTPRSLCLAEDGAGAGAAGGGLGAPGGAAAAIAAGGGDGAGAGGAPNGEAGDGAGGAANGEEPEWLASFSADGGDASSPSNRDWLKVKGFKTPDDAIKSYRETEKALLNGGKFTVPGDKATPEEIAAYHRAIGVPETAEKYEFALPAGEAMDEGFVTPMRTIAHKAGIPAPAFKSLAEGFVAWQADQLEATRTAEDQSAAEVLKGWGDQKVVKMADVSRAMAVLDITPQDVAGIQQGFQLVHGKPGSARTLELLARLGAGMAEDMIIGGEKRRFGVTGAEAQAEIDRLIVDNDFGKKLAAKEPEAVARWNRLNAAVAADVDRRERAEAAEAAGR